MRIREDIAISSGQQSETDLLSGMANSVKKGATITRVVGSLIVVPDLSDQHTHHTWGLVVVSDEAFNAGALPEADLEAERVSWLWREGGDCSMSSLFDHSQETAYRFDIRSQRVLRDELSTLAFIIDQGSGGGVFHSLKIRTLVKFR